MKKTTKMLLSTLLLLLLVLLSSCRDAPPYVHNPVVDYGSPSADDTNPFEETQFQQSLQGERRTIGSAGGLAENANGYFYTNTNGRIWFIDKATMTAYVACNVAGCAHTDTKQEYYDCLGVTPGLSTLAYYDGKLYGLELQQWVLNLYRMDPGGKNRETVLRLEQPPYHIDALNRTPFALMDGWLIYSPDGYDVCVTELATAQKTSVFTYAGEKLVWEIGRVGNLWSSVSVVDASGNTVGGEDFRCLWNFWVDDGKFYFEGFDPAQQQERLWTVTPGASEAELVWHNDKPIAGWTLEDGVMTWLQPGEGVYACDLATGQTSTILADAALSGVASFDRERIYINTTGESSEFFGLRVFSRTGQALAQLDMTSLGEVSAYTVLGSDGDYLFVATQDGGNAPIYAWSLDTLDSGEWIVLKPERYDK